MRRVALDLVMLALRQEYERTGDERFNVGKATVRQWKSRGRISKGEGYDLDEITRYLDSRDTRAVISALLFDRRSQPVSR